MALAYNSTPHTLTGFSPFLLLHGREAVTPVKKYLDKHRLDVESRRWLRRLWKARASAYEKHALHAAERKKWVENFDALLPVGTSVAVKPNPLNKADYPNKLELLYVGPWVLVKRFTNS